MWLLAFGFFLFLFFRDRKFNEIELTALVELNKMIINSGIPLEKIPLYILSDFIYPTPIGLRVVAAWYHLFIIFKKGY
jgi:hypothetical protein